MDRETKREFRQRMIAMILATDMAEHFKELGRLKAQISQPEYNPGTPEEKLKTLGFLMHMADISNPTKKWDLCFKWTELLFCEFFY